MLWRTGDESEVTLPDIRGCFFALVCLARMHVGHVSIMEYVEENLGTPFMCRPALYKYSLQGCPRRWCHKSFSVFLRMYKAFVCRVLVLNCCLILSETTLDIPRD